MRLPVKKSVFWLLYHRQNELFISFFMAFCAVGSFTLAVVNFKTSPASIVFFVASIYCAYASVAQSWKLIKEWRNV